MSKFSDEDRPHYDEDGNIVFPQGEPEEVKSDEVWLTTEYDEPAEPNLDHLTISQIKRRDSRVHRQEKKPLSPRPPSLGQRFKKWTQGLGGGAKNLAKASLNESKQQLSTSAKDVSGQIKGFGGDFKAVWQRFKARLFQPVWVINKRKQTKKQTNRATLFVFDALRFGTTFAVLFGLLFVSLNYQSFWKIMSSNIQPLNIASLTESAGASALRKQGGLSLSGKQADPLTFLPAVGPPDNRIVIPKLGLNVPIQTPPLQSLVNEDWKQLEVDIQDSLKDGVVHYPGTAKPGQAGNFFITGHSSYYPTAPGNYKTVFATLHKLDVGDEYMVYHNGDMHRYIVRSKKEVKPSNVSVLDQPLDKRVSTLMTCTPVGTTLRRLVLISDEVDPITGQVLKVGQGQQRPEQKIAVETLPI